MADLSFKERRKFVFRTSRARDTRDLFNKTNKIYESLISYNLENLSDKVLLDYFGLFERLYEETCRRPSFLDERSEYYPFCLDRIKNSYKILAYELFRRFEK